MSKRCCVGGCNATSSTNRLFCIPANDNLRNLWMSFLVPTNPILLGLSKEQLACQRVCNKHFDRNQFDYGGGRLRYSYPCLFTENEIKHGVPLTTDEYTTINEHNYCVEPEEENDDRSVEDEPAILTGRQDNTITNEHLYSLPWEYPGISESEKKALIGVSSHSSPYGCGKEILKTTPIQVPGKWQCGKSEKKTESTSMVCEAPLPATRAPATSTPATPTSPSEPKPLQFSPPEELNPLAVDLKLEPEDSDTETYCTEEPVFEKTNEEHVATLTDIPGDMTNTEANPCTSILRSILLAKNTVNIASQTQAPLTCHIELSKLLRRVDPKEIKNINRPPIKVKKSTLPISVLKRLKSDNQKQVVHPTAQLPQSDSTVSLTNLPPRDIAQKRLLAELEVCRKENFALRKELYTLRKRNKLLENRLINSNDRKAMFHKLTANMSAPAKALFEMQFQSKTKIKGRRYSLPGRIIALSIYKASPACYALLSKYFVLPSMRMMNRFNDSAKQQMVAAETNAAKETELNQTENQEDYNMNDTFQQEIVETSEAVGNIVNKTHATNNETQRSQGGKLEQEEVILLSDDTRSTGSSVEVNPTVTDPQSAQECDHGDSHRYTSPQSMTIKPDGRPVSVDELYISKPLRSQERERAKQVRHRNKTQQQQSKHRDPVKPTSKQVIEPQILQMGEDNAIETTHTLNEQTKYFMSRLGKNITLTRISNFPDCSKEVTQPVSSLKHVVMDEKLQGSGTSSSKIPKHYQRYLKSKETTDRGQDMPD